MASSASIDTKKRKSGKRCVVMNCNKTNLDGVSLHQFPKNVKLREKWCKFVSSKRKNWTPGSGHICNDHCKEDYHGFLQKDIGLSSELILKKDAIPTIQPTVVVDCQDDQEAVHDRSIKRRKIAVTKTNAHRVSLK